LTSFWFVLSSLLVGVFIRPGSTMRELSLEPAPLACLGAAAERDFDCAGIPVYFIDHRVV
jgi:hypothetical protein